MKKLLAILFSLIISFAAHSQQKQIDSLLIRLKAETLDTSKVQTLNLLSNKSLISGKYQLADSFAKLALQLSQKLNYATGICTSYRNIGAAYWNQGNYPEALQNQYESLRTAEAMGDKRSAAMAYSNIGSVYFTQTNYTKSLEVYLKSLDIAKEIHNDKLLANIFGNLGVLYYNLGNYAQAINNQSQSLKYSQKLNNPYGSCNALVNLGSVYYDEGKYDTALQNYIAGLEIGQRINSSNCICFAYTGISNIYTKQKRYSLAEKFLDSGLNLSLKIQNKELIQNAYQSKAMLDSGKGNYKNGLQDYKIYVKYKDSLVNEDNTQKIVQAQMTYDFDKKEAAQKADQDRKDALRDSEEARQKTLIWLIASITLTLILLLVIIFQRMKDVEKKKLAAEQQKAWLELKALRTQMNPHFLYNTINSIQSFVLNNDSKSSYNYLAQFAGLMRSTLDNSRKEKISLTDEIEGLKNYLDFEAMRFPTKFNYEFLVDPNLDQAKTFIPPLLVQPYVENAIWHGLMHLKKGEGKLLINFVKENDRLKCIVDDNGIGRTAAAELKKNSLHKSAGLAITEERMESMNKMYQWDMKTITTDKTNTDRTPAGTRVELYLPLIQNQVTYA